MLLPAGISGEAGFTIDNSLRFRQSAGAYLTRPQSAGNQTTWTWSAWVKLGYLNNDQWLFGGYYNTSNFTGITINLGTGIQLYQKNGGSTTFLVREAPIRRDYSSWYHFVIAYDSTEATNTDRIRFYTNGEQITTYASTTWPDASRNSFLNYNAATANIGRGLTTGNAQFDGYQTEINFIDGQALDPTDFGEFDATTGVWKPKKYTGTYGTNGFYLDGSGVTDSSGSGNNWTNNNLNLTTSSATTYDLMTDVPTLTDENAANYCTVNPLDTYNGSEISDGNLSVYESSAVYSKGRGTTWVDVEDSDGWYFEAQMGRTVAGFNPGIIDDSVLTTSTWGNTGAYGIVPRGGGGGNNYDLFSGTSLGTSTGIKNNVSDNIISVAFKNGKLYFAVDGTWVLSCDPETESNPCFSGLTGLYAPYYSKYADSYKSYFNFGQRPFAYTPPTGFKSLNTHNLPDSTIVDGSKHMNVSLYNGTGAVGHAITGVGFQPDVVWIKSRSQSSSHGLHDSLRVIGNYEEILYPNLTNAGNTGGAFLSSFDSDGFTVNNNNSGNGSGNTYVGWTWKAGGSGVSNSVGSIPSTVSANTTSGFSLVTYTGNATAGATVGHGLGVAPKFLFTKSRTTGTYDWVCQHTSLGGTKRIWLNLTSAANTSSGPWNNTDASSTVVTLGNFAETNASGDNFVMYCFAPVEGFSAFGSYTGNGSADGPFIYTGFSPSWLLIKRSDAAANWLLYDNKRLGYNANGYYLLPDGTWVEGTGADNRFDLISNGFKVRDSNQSLNVSGGTYIYAAFAENPFKNALAR